MTQFHQVPLTDQKARSNLAKFVPLAMDEEYLAFYDDTVFSRRTAGLVLTNQRLVRFKKRKILFSVPMGDVDVVDFKRILNAYRFSVAAGDQQFEIDIALGSADEVCRACQALELVIADVHRKAGRRPRPVHPVAEAYVESTALAGALSPEDAGQILQLARFGKGDCSRVAVSPDGRLLAVSTPFGIFLYDAQTLAEERFLETEQAASSVAWSPDGATLAVGLIDGSVQLQHSLTGKLLHGLAGNGKSIHRLAFSPDGAYLASGWLGHRTMGLWRVSDGCLLREFEGESAVADIAWAPDSTLIAVGRRNLVELRRMKDGGLLHSLSTEVVSVNCVAFSPDGTRLATVSGGNIQFWSMPDGAVLETIESQSAREGALGIAFSPDGTTLAAGYSSGTVRLWRVCALRKQLLHTLEGHSLPVRDVIWLPRIDGPGPTLISRADDRTIRLWQASEGVPLRTLEGHETPVRNIRFSPDGGLLASSHLGTALLRKVADGSLLRSLAINADVAFPPDGDQITTVSETSVQFWRISDGQLLKTLEPESQLVSPEWPLAFSPDGKLLALGGLERSALVQGKVQGALLVWDMSGSERLHKITIVSFVRSLAFSPDGEKLAVGRDSGQAELRSTSNLLERRALKGHKSRGFLGVALDGTAGQSVHGLAFSPHGLMLAASCPDRTIRVWRVSDGTLLRTLERVAGAMLSVAWSPDGKLLASGTTEGDVQLWRVADATLLRTLQGHRNRVSSVSFSPDGKLLGSASHDGTVMLWGIAH